LWKILPEVRRFPGSLAVIGTPCQIAALRLLQEKEPELRKKVTHVIGNFCGGFRDLRETDTLVQRAGLSPRELVRFRYRGGGQPGSMRMETSSGDHAELPYPHYVRKTGYVKHKRCRTCVDATAELADFACGDAWIPRFLETGRAWSLLLTRSTEADRVLATLVEEGIVEVAHVEYDEIVRSQRDNLTSKKTRQLARRYLMGMMGMRLPEFDGGYNDERSSMKLETRVMVQHTVFHFLERCGLYPTVAKLLRRY
jgi:coenzyme F420 hydrogenase subunit beta